VKNFLPPLPEDNDPQLRSVSEFTNLPATTLARKAVDSGLMDLARRERHLAIARYAADTANTELDLDRDLEAAGIEHLLDTRT
jgi:hypothetical protein